MHRRATPRCRASHAIPVVASILALSAAAGAQPPPRPAGPAGPGAPLTPLPGTVATVPAPPQIDIKDDMLTPVPVAPHVLTNWKDALNLILTRSTTLATALQEVERAEGNARVALAGALPTITGSASVTGQLIKGSTSVASIQNPNTGALLPAPILVPVTYPTVNPLVTASLLASQPILAPRAWYGIRTAELGVTSAKYAVDDQKRQIFTSVASSIITVFTAERTAEINRQGLKSALQVVDLTERQARLGAATRLDVVRAQQSAATARATLVSGDEAVLQAREALGLALGFRYAYGVPASLSLNEIEATVRGVCAPGPLDDRADIRKARNDIEVAKRGITDAWLAFSPTATLSTTASYENNPAAQADDRRGAWNIMGVLTIPLWEGGARYGNLRIAKAQAEETKITLEAALRSADIQITQALRGVAVAEKERVVSEQARDLAKELARLTMSSYLIGNATNFDLVNTEQTWRAAELDLIVKEFAVIQAKLSAVLATSNCTY
jgi:outer membrane protein TolC